MMRICYDTKTGNLTEYNDLITASDLTDGNMPDLPEQADAVHYYDQIVHTVAAKGYAIRTKVDSSNVWVYGPNDTMLGLGILECLKENKLVVDLVG